jgi:ribosomal protein L11 methyltransferase
MTRSPTPKYWSTLSIDVEPAAVEAVEFFFNEIGALGTETGRFRQIGAGPVKVTGYFETVPEQAEIDEALAASLQAYAFDEAVVHEVEQGRIADSDWLSEWKRHWVPTSVGRFVIAAPWHSVDIGDAVVIRIEPNMAFGTGTHETTRLCLRAIDEYYKPGMSFLDIGTGTGILAIAAAKLGGPTAKITAFDIDPDAVRIARENATLNGVDQTIEFFTGTFDETTPPADLVCANLTLNAIRPVLLNLTAMARVALVLSGILADQEDEARSCLPEYPHCP